MTLSTDVDNGERTLIIANMTGLGLSFDDARHANYGKLRLLLQLDDPKLSLEEAKYVLSHDFDTFHSPLTILESTHSFQLRDDVQPPSSLDELMQYLREGLCTSDGTIRTVILMGSRTSCVKVPVQVHPSHVVTAN